MVLNGMLHLCGQVPLRTTGAAQFRNKDHKQVRPETQPTSMKAFATTPSAGSCAHSIEFNRQSLGDLKAERLRYERKNCMAVPL